MPGMGRNYIPDERDRGFLMRTVVPRATPDRRWRYWWPAGWWGDQGALPHCVAYAWLHKLHDGPRTRSSGPAVGPQALYCEAQKLDPWDGDCENHRYDGTSVRAGAKALQARGLIDGYRWAWDLETVVDTILTTGPVVLGTLWYEGMSRPYADGTVTVAGSQLGGHAYVANGVNRDRELVRCKNSWSRSWGRNGYFYLSFADLRQLLLENGEACLPMGAP